MTSLHGQSAVTFILPARDFIIPLSSSCNAAVFLAAETDTKRGFAREEEAREAGSVSRIRLPRFSFRPAGCPRVSLCARTYCLAIRVHAGTSRRKVEMRDAEEERTVPGTTIITI